MGLRLMKREHEFARKIANVNLLEGTQTRIRTRNGKRAFARENANVPYARENANVPFARSNANVPFARSNVHAHWLDKNANVPFAR